MNWAATSPLGFCLALQLGPGHTTRKNPCGTTYFALKIVVQFS